MVGTAGQVREISIHLELPRMTKDDLEDLLATDDLFINYFNNFLSLQCFPEPLRFNKENSVFELVSAERKRLAAEIKQAYRANKRQENKRKKQIIYGSTKKKLIPLEPIALVVPKVINTSFTVKALNREQGIQWIKAERLPAFLQSDLYLEYQLAKLVSQSHAINKHENQCFIRLKVVDPRGDSVNIHNDGDDSSEQGDMDRERSGNQGCGSRLSEGKTAGVKTKEEEIPEYVRKLEKEKQMLMEELFVCMSATSTSDAETIMAYARLESNTITSSVMQKHEPDSVIVPSMHRAHSGRPFSAMPSSSSFHRGLDSGLYKVPSTLDDQFDVSPYTKNLKESSADEPSVSPERDDENLCRKPTVLDDSCMVAHEPENTSAIYMPFPVETGDMVKCWKEQQEMEDKQERLILEHMEREQQQRDEKQRIEEEEEREAMEREVKEQEEGEDKEEMEGSVTSPDAVEPSTPSTPSPAKQREDVVVSQDDATISTVDSSSSTSSHSLTDKSSEKSQRHTLETLPTVDNLNDISAAVTGSMMKYTVADLIEKDRESIEAMESLSDTVNSKPTILSLTQMECVVPTDAVVEDGIATVNVDPGDENVFAMLRSLAKHGQPEDDDDETNSLFDSDEDYEGERDDFFRDHSRRKRVKRLTTTKGIIDFKQYIHGTPGEVNWNLWIDIERACLIPDKNELNSFLHAMRDRYQVTGAPYELSMEVKVALGLAKPSAWTLKKLCSIHYKVAEPLILYWGPRYLVHQEMKVNTKKHRQYTLQRRMRTPDICTSYPDPPKPNLMPLRPKTCLPRMQPDTSPLPSDLVLKMDVKEPVIRPTYAAQLHMSPTDPRRPLNSDIPTDIYSDSESGDVKRTCSLPDINVVRNVKMLKDLVNMEQLKGQPWVNKGHFIPLTPKELVKYGHIPPLPGKLREMWVNESVVSMFPYVTLRPTVICPPALQPPSGQMATFRSSRTPSAGRSIVTASTDRRSQTVTPHQTSGSTSINKSLSILQGSEGSVTLQETHEATLTDASDATAMPITPSSGMPDTSLYATLGSTMKTPDAVTELRQIPEPSGSIMSEFLGSKRMEGLLQALANERNSGLYLRSFIRNSDHELWAANLNFWEDLQDYHTTFHCNILEPFVVIKKAKLIHSKYIVPSAPQHISCALEVSTRIGQHLDPPYEDLFDEAEEFSLTVLADSWEQALLSDSSTFQKVELAEENRLLVPGTEYLESLQDSGVIEQSKVAISTEQLDKDKEDSPRPGLHPPPSPRPPPPQPVGEEDPVYDNAMLECVPDKFRDWNLEKLIHNRMELQHFRDYLAENYASTDLNCWLDIEAYRRTSYAEEKIRDEKAHDIQTKYLNKKYFFGPNSPAGKLTQAKVISMAGGWGKLLDATVPPATLLEAQKHVRRRLENKWLPLFLSTSRFAERQRPETGLDNITEDLLIQKRRKSQALWKLLDSKWVSSSKDILTFRKALVNPVTSLQFRRYVSLKGELLENDVLFWQEIQKYKELCHLHSDRVLIQQKTMVIISCFIDSPIPPGLQVDITADMAERILERKMEATPYLFREAQLTVFRVLFSHWPDFGTFRSDLTKETVLPTVERNKQYALKQKQREAEAEEDEEELGLEASDLDVKDSLVSWTYSQYVEALDKEEALNKTEEETFVTEKIPLKKVPETTDESEFDDDDSEAVSVKVLRKTKQAPLLRNSSQHAPVPPSVTRTSFLHSHENKFRPQARIVRRSQQVD